MKTFILIMIMSMPRYDGGVGISTAEFNSKKACQLASIAFSKMQKNHLSAKSSSICVPK